MDTHIKHGYNENIIILLFLPDNQEQQPVFVGVFVVGL